MTNAEKYLKDGVDIENFTNSLCGFVENWELRNGIKNFLKKKVKPTLTEDERAILRNMIPQAKTIARDTDGELIIKICSDTIAEDFCYSGAFIYNHLFQFIKERRRIFDS